tara:strand:- start:424 stop:855 length:432 start_codon:yes stop_codon:yes gene_type:complete
MLLSLSEIINKACKMQTKEEKVEWLRKNDTAPLRTILKNTYDKSVEFLIPSVAPPWKKNGYFDVEGMLFKEARRLRIFIKGGGYDNLNQIKRENLFISLLQDVDDKDADLLCTMIAQKPIKGLTKETVLQAFPNLIKLEEKEK